MRMGRGKLARHSDHRSPVECPPKTTARHSPAIQPAVRERGGNDPQPRNALPVTLVGGIAEQGTAAMASSFQGRSDATFVSRASGGGGLFETQSLPSKGLCGNNVRELPAAKRPLAVRSRSSVCAAVAGLTERVAVARVAIERV